MLPDRIGRYKIVERLGSGGMGVLYRGTDPVLHRDIAIKVLIVDRLAEPQARERFYREARAAARLQHPNIVTIYEFVEGESPYLVMELLQGSDLDDRLSQAPPLTLAQRIDVVLHLCDALSCAHNAGVVHRDVKPSNVWLLPDGRVKLLDFGIAKFGSSMTSSRDAVGTTPFMAPEQFQGGAIDGRTDVFSTGVLLYQLLTGARPFEADTPGEVILKILSVDPVPVAAVVPDLPVELSEIVARTLQKRPEARYHSIAALGDDLRRIRAVIASAGEPAIVGGLYVEPIPERDAVGANHADDRLPTNAGVAGRWTALAAFVLIGATGLAWAVVKDPSEGASLDAAALPPVAAPAAPSPPQSQPPDRESKLVSITSEPRGAAIEIDGAPSGKFTPATFSLALGKGHQIRLTKPDFVEVVRRIDATTADDAAVEATLQPLNGRAVVTVSGSYAFEVRDDDNRVLSAAAKQHLLTVTTPKRLSLRAPTLYLNQIFSVGVNETRKKITVPPLGYLTIRAVGAGCQISIDGQHVNNTPIEQEPVAAGEHEIRAICPQLITRRVRVRPGETHREDIR